MLGVPLPDVEWQKDGVALQASDKVSTKLKQILQWKQKISHFKHLVLVDLFNFILFRDLFSMWFL